MANQVLVDHPIPGLFAYRVRSCHLVMRILPALIFLSLLGCRQEAPPAVPVDAPPAAVDTAGLVQQIDQALQSKDASTASSVATVIMENADRLAEQHPGKDAVIAKIRDLASQAANVGPQQMGVLARLKTELQNLK